MDTHHIALWASIKQTAAFVAYVARQFPSFYFIAALTLFVLLLEYAATSLMIPLAASEETTSVALQTWRALLNELGLEPRPRTWLWLFLLIMIARLFFGYIQTISTTFLGKSVHRTLSEKIFQHVISHEPLESIYGRSIGHYITLAGDDTFRCGTIISSLLQCVVGFCSSVVALIVLYQFSVPLFTAVVAFLMLCVAMIAFLLRHILKLNAKSITLSRGLNTAFVEALNSVRSIRTLGGQKFVCTSYASQIADYVWMLFKIEAVRVGLKTFPVIILLVIAAILLRPGAELSLSQASLFAGTVIVIRIFASLGQLLTAGSLLLPDIRAARDIKALIHSSSDLPAPQNAVVTGSINNVTLSSIYFGYVARDHLLDNLSFRFEKGKTYAIVGPSGSGKSTLADIMLGLVKPDSGALSVNDGQLNFDAVRERFMLVEQQPKIFSATLRENLLFGLKTSDERLWELLRLVDLESTVKNLPNGLDTQLSYLGENFSGGQRQRIGIARALVRNPDVLILDEATSALDQRTRALVVGNIRHHGAAGIIIFITHDTEIAKLADKILVVDKGYMTLPTDPL